MNIQKNIETANNWLTENRSEFNPITMDRVLKRLETGGLLSIEADSKTIKGSKNGYLTGILYLAPHSIIGFNMCPFAVTCIKDCLFNAGRGRFSNVTESRIIKTLAWLYDPQTFKANLIKDIGKLEEQAIKQGMKPVVRLNGTSDLLIERVFVDVLAKFPNVQFYDYTKNPFRFKKTLPANYDLTFSFDGQNQAASESVLKSGGRVAVVFKNQLPASFLGYTVVDGDSSDLRFLDAGGVVVGLIAKGSAKKENANKMFIVDLETDDRCSLGELKISA